MTFSLVYWIHTYSDIDPQHQGYIGVAENDFESRLYRHIRDAKLNKHINKNLQAVLLSDYVITFLYSGSVVDCYNRERNLRPSKRMGLNIAAGGKGGPNTLGMKMSAEFCRKRSDHMLGNKLAEGNHKSKSEEHRKKIGAAHRGKLVSQDQRKKQSLAMKGRKCSPEHIKKQSDARRGNKRGPYRKRLGV